MNRIQQLETLILRLHQGESQESVKEDFKRHFETVKSSEIIAMEQQLVNNGMPIEKIQSLCDIHADVFNQSIEEIHGLPDEMERDGHPVHVLKSENRALEAHLEAMFPNVLDLALAHKHEQLPVLLDQMNELFDLDKHYKRKEFCIFPLLEKHGFDAPPKVMWGVDDEIRADLKALWDQLMQGDMTDLQKRFELLRKRIEDMIFKEEMIMLPMISEVVTEDDWLKVAQDSDEIGYCLVVPKEKWIPRRKSFYDIVKEDLAVKGNQLNFKVGHMNFAELEAMMNVLPIDITFIDKDDTFKYFNQTSDRVFARPQTAIGRKVQHCHPPKSLDMVQGILDDFKSGAKDTESFWIPMGPKLIYISFHAVRDDFGQYLGCVEVTQDIKPYQGITGQKRLREGE